MSDVKVKITADNSGLTTGLQKAKGDVDKFAKDTEGAFSGLGSKLKSIFAVGAIIAAARAAVDFGSAIKDASDALDMSAESLQGLQGAFGQSGTNAEKFRLGMSDLNKSLQEARNNTGSARDSFEALGIKWEDIRDKTPEQILYMIADGMRNATDKTQALVAVMDLLGRAGKTMASGLAEGSAELRKNAAEVTKLTDEEVAAIDRLGDAWARAKTKAMVYLDKALLAVGAIGTHEKPSQTGAGSQQGSAGNAFMGMGGMHGAKSMSDAIAQARAREPGQMHGPEYAPQFGPEQGFYDETGRGADDPQKLKEAKEIDDDRKRIAHENAKLQAWVAEEYAKQDDERAKTLAKEQAITAEKEKQALLAQQAAAEDAKAKVDDAVENAQDALVGNLLKSPDQRRQERRDEQKRERAENRAQRLLDGKGVSTIPGSKGEMDKFKELKELQSKAAEHLKTISETLKTKLGTA